MENEKHAEFCYYVIKGDSLIDAFEKTYPKKAQKMSLQQKQYAINLLLKKPTCRAYLKERIRSKKQAHTLADIESALSGIAEASPLDFLALGRGYNGKVIASWQPVANADFRAIKSIETRKDGSVKIVLYDRLDALKSLATIQSMRAGTSSGAYTAITNSLNNLLEDIKKETRVDNNDGDIIMLDENDNYIIE